MHSHHIKIIYTFALIFFIVCVFWHPSTGVARQGTKPLIVDVEGTGVVIENNIALARDNAVNDALRKAVEQAVGMFVSSERMVESYQIIDEGIYSKARSYIQNYRVVNENPDESNYVVKVRATVSLGSIGNDLQSMGVLMVRQEMPRIMVVIAEQNVGQQYPSNRWVSTELTISEDVIKSKFLERGFTFVDNMALTDEIDIEKSCSDEYTVSLGKRKDAELVIVGKALARYSGDVAGTTMKSFRANITAKVIRTDNGVVIASANAQGSAINVDDLTGGSEAIDKAARQLAILLRSQVIDKWQKEVGSTKIVTMTVRRIESCSDFVRFVEALKTKIRGIKNIFPRRMASGIVKFDLNIQGNVQSLADKLAAKNFSDFSLEITNISRNSIELNLSK